MLFSGPSKIAHPTANPTSREEDHCHSWKSDLKRALNTDQVDGLWPGPYPDSQGMAPSHILQEFKEAQPTVHCTSREIQSEASIYPDIVPARELPTI